jgi:adenylate cyclase
VEPEGTERRLAAILSADAVGYSRHMAEDEDATVRRITAYREQMAVLVRQHRGRVVDAKGDNLLAEFPSVTDATACAVQIQRVLRVRNADLPSDRKLEFRLGVHLGEVVVEGDSIYGDGINIAARLEGLAEPGGICISEAVRDQVKTKLDLDYDDLGEQSLKNIAKPVRLYRVRFDEARADSPKATGHRRTRLKVAAISTAAVVGVVAGGLWLSWPAPLGLESFA